MRSTMYLVLSMVSQFIGIIDGATIATTVDNNNDYGTVTDGTLVETQSVMTQQPVSNLNRNAGFMEREFNQEMAELRGVGQPRRMGENGMRQHAEFEWRNRQAVGTKGLIGEQFFGENENEGIVNGNGVNGMVNQELREFEGPRAFQQAATGNAANDYWNQKDYVWGDYGWEEPNRWKRQADFEGEGFNDGWDGAQMLNAENGWDQWNEIGNERKKRATQMKDVNQWVMRGIGNVNFADIDWAGQIARAIAKWNRMQVLANTKSKAIANGDTPKDTIQDTLTTDIPTRDPGTIPPTTGATNNLQPVKQSVTVGTPNTDIPIGDTGTAIPTDVLDVTDNIPQTTWSTRQVAAEVDYTWSDYRPGEQPAQEPNGIDYMVDYGQDPEFPPNAIVEVTNTQAGDQQMKLDNGQAGEQGAANEWAADYRNTPLNYDYNNVDYGQGGNNRNKRAPPRVNSLNEWILQDIRKVNFADDDWLGQIAMAIAVWNQRHAADTVNEFAVDYGNPTTATTVDMNTPGDIPLLVPAPIDMIADSTATTVSNIPSSMNINAPTFEGPTTPVNVPVSINAFVEDPTLGAVNVPSSVNGNTPIIILPTIPDITPTDAPIDFITAPTRNIIAESPSFTNTAMDITNEVHNDKDLIQVTDGKGINNVASVIQDYPEPMRLMNPFTTGTIPDPNPEQTTNAAALEYFVTEGLQPAVVNQINYDAPMDTEPWMADANKGDYGWGDYKWTENRAVKVDQWGNNAQDNADYNYDYYEQNQLNGGDNVGNGQTNTPDYTAVDYTNTDYGTPATVGNGDAEAWKGDVNWNDYGWDGARRMRREIENEGWWDKRQLKGMTNGFDYMLTSGKTKRAATINDLNKWIMSDIDKVNFGDDDWLGQIAMAIVTWRERAMAESGGKVLTNGDTPNPIDNADADAPNVLPIDTTTSNPGWNTTPSPTVEAITDLQMGTDAPRALNAPTEPNDINNIVEADTQKVKAPRGLRGPWNADYVAGDYSWGKPPLVSPESIYNGDYNWLDYALGNLLDTGNQGDYNWGAVDNIGQQPAVQENPAKPEGNGADVGFETNPKMMDGTNLFNVDYGNTDYGFDGQNQVAQTKGDNAVADTGNVKQFKEVIGEVNPETQATTDGTVLKIQEKIMGEVNPENHATTEGTVRKPHQKVLGEVNPANQATTEGTVRKPHQNVLGEVNPANQATTEGTVRKPHQNVLGEVNPEKQATTEGTVPKPQQKVLGEVNPDYQMTTDGNIDQINAVDQPITGETNWQDNGWQAARQTGNAKWLGDFNWGDYGWGGNTNDRKKREVENEGWWDVRKLTMPLDNNYGWNDYGLSMERVKRAGTNMKIAKAVNEWVLRDINKVNFADDDWPGMIAQSIATWKRHFIKTGHKAVGFDQMPERKEATAIDGATATATEVTTTIPTDGATATANDGMIATGIDSAIPINPPTRGTTNEPLNGAVDAVTDTGVELNNLGGAVKMAVNMWNDYGISNTDYRVPETTTYTWSTDSLNYPGWNAQTTPTTNTIDADPLIENWKRQIKQASETGQILETAPEPITVNDYLDVGRAINPMSQLIEAATGDNTVVENPNTNVLAEINLVPDTKQISTINQQSRGGLEDELKTMDNIEGPVMRAIKTPTNNQAEDQISNPIGDPIAVDDQWMQTEGTGTVAETKQSFTNAQIKKLKRIAEGNGVNVDGGPGDLNEINWFDYAGFGEYEGGVKEFNGGFFEEPAIQMLEAEAGNAETNDYNWIDYGRPQQFTDYDGQQKGVDGNAAEGVQNQPDYNVFEFSTAGFVDGQNGQKGEGGNEQWQPSGVPWADYGGNRMKRGINQKLVSERTKTKPVLSRNQRIELVQTLLKSALKNHRAETKKIYEQRARTHQDTNRQKLKTTGDIAANRKWLSRRLAAYNILDGLPLRRYIAPSEIDNWWTRKQINGGGRENGRNKRGVFGRKDVGHDVKNSGRRVSMPDAKFRRHEFSSSMLIGHRAIKNQFAEGLDGNQDTAKNPSWNNGVILSKIQANDIKRSTVPNDGSFMATGSSVNDESPLTSNGVDFRALAPRTVTTKPEVNDRVVEPVVKADRIAQLTSAVDLPKVLPDQHRDKTLGKDLGAVLKISDAGRGYIESVQSNKDRSSKSV